MDQFVDHGQHLEVPPRATSHPSLAKLGARVRQLRKLKKWTQEDLAAECRLDRSYISGLESGRRNPTYLNLVRLAKNLGLSISALVDL